MIHTTFNQIPFGAYFLSVFTNAMFVKHNCTDAATIKLDGLRDHHELEYEFDPTTEVLFLFNESEWPIIDYKDQIRAWNWARIKETAAKNLIYDSEDDQPKGTAWLGTTIGVMPSGKIYAMWTSNQNDEDVNRDQQFLEALEIVFGEQKMFIDWSESGNLFASKHMNWEEIGRTAGYTLEQAPIGLLWKKGFEESEDIFGDEEDAWKDCCITNKLVEVV